MNNSNENADNGIAVNKHKVATASFTNLTKSTEPSTSMDNNMIINTETDGLNGIDLVSKLKKSPKMQADNT